MRARGSDGWRLRPPAERGSCRGATSLTAVRSTRPTGRFRQAMAPAVGAITSWSITPAARRMPMSATAFFIVAQKESYSGFNYTSAKIRTRGLFSQKYGRFEFRARLPEGKGYWPALWMMPEDSVYRGWPASGEIDVMENRGSDPAAVLGTIHFGSSSKHAQSSGPPYKSPSGDSVTNFHVYAVEWSEAAISWACGWRSL